MYGKATHYAPKSQKMGLKKSTRLAPPDGVLEVQPLLTGY